MSITRWPSAALLAGLLAACSGPSGPVRTETRSVGEFHAIELRGAADAEVTVGRPSALRVTADEATLQELVTRVENGVLLIESRERGGWFRRRAKLELHAETPVLDSVVLSGAGNFAVHEAAGEKLSLVMQGAGSLSADGRTASLEARIDGAGNMSLHQLLAGDAEVSVNGAGNLSVHATGNLTATVNGVGNIKYSGNPGKTVTSVHGVGSISPDSGNNP